MQLKKISLTYTGNVLHTCRFHLIRNEKPHHLLKSGFSQALPEATAELYCLSYYRQKSAAQTTTNELWRNWSHRQWTLTTRKNSWPESRLQLKVVTQVAKQTCKAFSPNISIWLNHATETDVSSFTSSSTSSTSKHDKMPNGTRQNNSQHLLMIDDKHQPHCQAEIWEDTVNKLNRDLIYYIYYIFIST